MIVLLAVLAGGLGAVTRLMVDGEVKSRVSDAVPWATMLINVTGSLVLGVLTGLAIRHSGAADIKVVLGTGFCGGYTTFSTASFETVRLVQEGSPTRAVAYSSATAVLGLAAAALGIFTIA